MTKYRIDENKIMKVEEKKQQIFQMKNISIKYFIRKLHMVGKVGMKNQEFIFGENIKIASFLMMF